MIEKIKRIIAVILCFLTLISLFPMQSFAWTSMEGEKASSREGEDYIGYDGEKYYYLKTLTHVIYDSKGNVSSHYTFTRTRPLDKYFLKHDGKETEAFCIEAGVRFEDSDEGYVSKSYKNSSYFSNLPEKVKNGISTALIYGWTKNVPSELSKQCNLDDIRLATQLIIWEYQQQIRTSPTSISSRNGVDADTFSHAIKNRPAEKAYNYILNKMKEHEVIPSFCSKLESGAKGYTLKYNSETNDYSITLVDTNNVLKDFKFNNSDLRVSRSGNKYTFTTTKRNSDYVTVSMKKDVNTTTESLLIWGMGGSQTMTTGCSDLNEFYFKFNTETYGKLFLEKNSEDGNVVEIKFMISGNNQRTKYVQTDYTGTLKVYDLLPGTYTITELPIDKYVAQQSQEFTIQSEKTTSLVFNNKLKKFNVKVKKYDLENNEVQGNASLEGAVYGLYLNDNLVQKYITNKEGEFLTNYQVCGQGWYIQEITPPKGYNLDETKYELNVTPEKFDNEYNSISCDVKDNVIKGKISITKHTDNGKTKIETPEEGAKFQVYLKSSKSYDDSKEAERDIIICDKDGIAETKDLPYGKYIVHQISGWDDREMIYDFEVDISENNKTYRYLVNNNQFESYLKIVKVDEETGKNITFSNATFSLYKYNDKSKEWNQVKCKIGGKSIEKWTTGIDGVAYTENKLKSGKYMIKEIKAPYGFIKTNKEIIFDISMSNSTLEYDEDWDAYITVVLENKRPEANIEINKLVKRRSDVDKSLISELDLSYIKFRLSAKEDIINNIDGSILFNSGDVIGDYNLDENGNLIIKDLNLGEYYIQEIETLPGLLLDTSKFEVLLNYENDDRQIYTKILNIENATTLVDISKTDITGEKELEGAELIVKDKDGNVIDRWISVNKSHKIEGLIGGEKYVLTEISAPNGYEIANSIEFEVDKNFETQKIVMIDEVIKYEEIKIEDNDTKEILDQKEIYTGINLYRFMLFDCVIAILSGGVLTVVVFRKLSNR